MNLEFYEQFIRLKNEGDRKAAKPLLDSFIASFETPEEVRAWVFDFLKRGSYGHVIKHEIYEELVYPTLLEGYLNHDAKSTAWLARTSANLYKIKTPHPSLFRKPELTLLREAYAIRPSEEIGVELLNQLVKFFEYAQHEWPMGILYGNDGASVEECHHILTEVEFARELDSDKTFNAFLGDFESKVREYLTRFEKRSGSS